jgi:DNA helicase HerA-like ATPase
MTGRGKSTFVKRLLARILEAGQRVIAWDLDDEYSQRGNRSLRDVEMGPLRERATVAELEAEPRRLLLRRDLSLAVVPTSDPDTNPEGLAQEFERCAAWVKRLGDVVFVVEEVSAIAARCEPLLNAIATRWRKLGVVLIAVAQFAVQVPIGVRKQCDVIVSFRQIEAPDLDALARKAGREFAAEVRRLRKGQCALWDAEQDPEGEPSGDSEGCNAGGCG